LQESFFGGEMIKHIIMHFYLFFHVSSLIYPTFSHVIFVLDSHIYELPYLITVLIQTSSECV